MPLLIALLRDKEISRDVEFYLYLYTRIIYNWGKNTPIMIPDLTIESKTNPKEPVSGERIKDWEEWYDKNKNYAPIKRPPGERYKLCEEILGPIDPKAKEFFQSAYKDYEEKLRKETSVVNDPSAWLEERSKSAEYLRECGKIDGLQSVLPEILKYRELDSSELSGKEIRKQDEKFLREYQKKVNPELAVKQLIKLISSDQERIWLRESAVSLAFIIREYITPDEVKNLIKKVEIISVEERLIGLLQWIGNKKDVPFLLNLAGSDNDEVQIKALNAISFISIRKKWPNIKADYNVYITDGDSKKYREYILSRWIKWWDDYN
jgi:hypothetical protein